MTLNMILSFIATKVEHGLVQFATACTIRNLGISAIFATNERVIASVNMPIKQFNCFTIIYKPWGLCFALKMIQPIQTLILFYIHAGACCG